MTTAADPCPQEFPMTLLDASVDVPADGRLTVSLPPGCPAAKVRVVVTADDAGTVPPDRGFAGLAIDTDFGADWDPAETFRREEMYGDDGR